MKFTLAVSVFAVGIMAAPLPQIGLPGGLGGLTSLLNAVPLLGGSLGGLGRTGEPKPVAKEELQKPVLIEKKPAMNEAKPAMSEKKPVA
ncbi:hypothetical protein VHEMI06554 [[Torrubiella] hemipterigena]|uniref:Uncharacterized protein n=1 Tax=[Torrubiella] hemipterigena TaxID=1531966 RepID=A0A0A1TLA9_9HYPO|nr:hypothetical protein VHEMI06554 [[Torrubiella] hemipterigena]